MHVAVPTPDQKLPVALITGFLGSGKTTLLARMLKHASMAKTAVIINEFGEIGLDHDLVETSQDDDNIVELSSGCLCCTVRGDLVRTIHDLYGKRQDGRIKPFERLVIETTGLADPAPILQTLMQDAAIDHFFRLESVITLVDAVNGEATLDRHEEAVKQAAVADRLVITKTDLATPEERKRYLNGEEELDATGTDAGGDADGAAGDDGGGGVTVNGALVPQKLIDRAKAARARLTS